MLCMSFRSKKNLIINKIQLERADFYLLLYLIQTDKYGRKNFTKQ